MNKRSFPFKAGGGEIRDLKQPGYYAGFSTMAQKRSWDDATRKVVEARVTSVVPVRFFSAEQAAVMDAVIQRVMPQDDRAAERVVPILGVIDERLFKNELNGFRYEDMPSDQDAYRRGITAIEEMGRARFHASFTVLTVPCQELLLKSLHDGKPDPEHAIWRDMPVHRFWDMLVEDCVTAYYAHPWAWDEIGFGGPAYPRGYMRLENGLPEPWEKDEQRYEWNAPADSLSDLEPEDRPGEQGALRSNGGRG